MITRVGAAVDNAASITIPAHQVGDLILAFAFRDGDVTNPTIPSENWTTITTTTDGTTCSVSAAWKLARDGSEVSGTWTNASGIAVAVYRGARIATGSVLPIGTFQASAGTTNTVTYPALSSMRGTLWAWVVAFAGHRSTDVTLETAPADLTNVANGAGATCEMSIHDSNGPYVAADTWPSTNVTITGTASGWQTMTIELRAQLQLPLTYREGAFRSRGLSVAMGRVR